MQSILTVVTPAQSQDLTIVESVLAEEGLQDGETEDQILSYIRQASDRIATHCRRKFGSEVVSEVYDLTEEKNCLLLSRMPVSAIASVTADDTLLASNDYVLDEEPGLLYRLSSGRRIKWASNAVTVQYTGGYALLAELPHAVERACLTLVATYRANRRIDPRAKRVEVPGVRTVDYWVGSMGQDGDIPPDVAAMLGPFRTYRI